LINGALASEPIRTWTSSDGEFTVEARFLGWKEESIRLERLDGRGITVSRDDFSEEDQQYLLGLGAEAFENAVYERDGTFRWKVSDEEKGETGDLAEAIQNAIGDGGREVHLLTGGELGRTIHLKPGLKVYGHGNTFEKTHNETGFYREGEGGIRVESLNLTGGTGWGFHFSRASDLTLEKISITGGGIGMRVESHPSRPYEAGRWVKNLVVKDCQFEGCRSHGIETYGVENIEMDGITARNCGECGVLINKGRNCTIGTVEARRCCYGGGYAGLRFANNCSDATVEKLTAIECGRGFFTVSECEDIVVEHVTIRDCTSHAILLQDSKNVGINGGTYNGHALNHYTSEDCWIKAEAVDVE
jgi:hypothetical protein